MINLIFNLRHSRYTNSSEPIQHLIDEVASKGPNVHIGIVKKILDRKHEALPILISLLKKDEIWDGPNEKYTEWTPMAIIHILSTIGGKDAFEAVKDSVLEHYDEAGDWIMEWLSSIMAEFGTEKFNELEEILKDDTIGEDKTIKGSFVRGAIAESLFFISLQNPQLKDMSMDIIKETISKEKEKVALSLFTDVIVEFKDKDSLPFVEQLFKSGQVDEEVLTFDTVLEIYKRKDSRSERKNPLHIFRENSFYRTHNSGGSIETHRNGYNPESTGRNDPCPCGSGKKYKKCCMKLFYN